MSRIFANLAINRVTRGNQAKYTHVDIDEQYDLASETTHDDLDRWGGLTPKQVLGFVQQLPEKYRLVLNMYAVDGFSHQEIAQKLNISVGSSKSRLSRARVMLKDNIKKS